VSPLDRTGVLLINLGTPDSPRVADVRRYLREFLSDPRVLDMPGPLRFGLLNFAILPFRPRRSAAAYASIWTDEGSPLLVHSQALAAGVARELGDGFQVELGMRYGQPGIQPALERLERADVSRIVVLPLFPQYASSSGGSAVAAVLRWAEGRWNVPSLEILPPFYAEPGFVACLAERLRTSLEDFEADHVLFSFHGLPERQIRKSDPGGQHCFATDACCAEITSVNRSCYRAQCFATTRAVVRELGLSPESYSVAFQSRLGRTPWIRPFTDEVLPELAARGVRQLAITCPSFVADCLETVEEIGIRARAQWSSLGGKELRLVPCLNTTPLWIQTLAHWLRPTTKGTSQLADN
jgi:ferrochelatase